jgi:hypothetical protein
MPRTDRAPGVAEPGGFALAVSRRAAPGGALSGWRGSVPPFDGAGQRRPQLRTTAEDRTSPSTG